MVEITVLIKVIDMSFSLNIYASALFDFIGFPLANQIGKKTFLPKSIFLSY